MSQTNEQNVSSNQPSIEAAEVLKETVASAVLSVEEIRQELADRAAEFEELHKAAEDAKRIADEQIQELKASVESLTEQLQKVAGEKEELASRLKAIEDENLLNVRLLRLKDAELLRSTEEAQYQQAAKVKEMSDDQFEIYFEELRDIASRFKTEAEETKAKIDAHQEQVKEEVVTEKVAETISEVAASDAEVEDVIKKVLQKLSLKPTSALAELEQVKAEEEDIEAADEAASAPQEKEIASTDYASLLATGFSKIASLDLKDN